LENAFGRWFGKLQEKRNMSESAAQSRSVKRPDTIDSHARAVQGVISTLQSRLDESISLKEMAAIAYMSPYQCKPYKKHTRNNHSFDLKSNHRLSKFS
jgi:transcriptional regulator GlxA family with amidase domain